ncbi:glycosyltransferase family 2 protein [Sinomonas gamaensis]|uniref:glycosyltransferase family 2 protein n=1 Tax=Sinomonas gamaensis TaxID=2565624 RepID=UPI0020164656|nr:glycosyltransferase family 2 protein [Sinomonas gamaensis]
MSDTISRPRIPVSVLVQTKNEEAGIGQCLQALASFGEVVVVDSNSTDRTAAIAQEHGARVVNFTWNRRYPKKKQWQLENVNVANNWVLMLDADERPSPELIDEIRTRLSEWDATAVAVDIPLTYVFSGRHLVHGHRVVKRALLRPEHVRFPEVDDLEAPGIGEVEGHYQPTVTGTIAQATRSIIHDDVDPVRTWFDRHNRYSDWEAYLRTNPASHSSVSRLRSRQGQIFDRIPFKPIAFFVYSYFIKQGWRDGQAGFDYAFALSFYYWQIRLKTREILRQRRAANQ